MSLVTHVSFAPKLLLIPTRYLAVIPRLRLFKLKKGVFLVDWDPSFHTKDLLLRHRCKVCLVIMSFQWPLDGYRVNN
jgi:hypothetical protein